LARDHSLKGERYYDCDLCGFTYRWSDTRINAGGLRVCTDHDLDIGPWASGGPVRHMSPPSPVQGGWGILGWSYGWND
jgi:hypothetical protein